MQAELKFTVDDALLEHGVIVGLLLFGGLENELQNEAEFVSFRDACLNDIMSQQNFAAVREHPHLVGYWRLHEQCGVDDRALVPSPESLFAALFKHRSLRRINPIVDIYNCVALVHRLSCGAHDLGQLSDAIRLHFSEGSIAFRPLGRIKEETIPAGEYAYIDGSGRAICRLECRQAAHSVVTPATTDVAIIFQGNANVSRDAIERAMQACRTLFARFLNPAAWYEQRLLGGCSSSSEDVFAPVSLA